MFNKVILVGNLTRDIELRYINTGSALGRTGIAVNRKYTVNGEKKEEVCFIDITFWGKLAEIANQYLRKGSQVLVEGRLMFETWQDQNGQNRSRHSITVENMQMLGGGSNQNSSHQQNSGYGQNNYQQNSGGYGQNSYQQNFKPNNNPYQKQQSPQNKNFQQDQNNFNDDGYENIPDVDIDDMGMDGDDELPF
ncbi:single-stranded DNA-binding protein [Campylobacter ureolyticus]|uniref:single-stranded DNA-binding protein n=1 Tax=Campylobacter ureolyticus TaxID=827 RepID=UPI0022B58028|nr:single-stranded DNA-binding protein [Campylobacter ureolyticus]MCZ6149688.1 single-stranded DNA-binding protein [Campylobacter ureolyticus]